MNWYDLLRGLHIIAVIAWMAALMLLPRLYAYHTETAPPGSEFDAHFLRWEGKVLKIIMTPAIGLTWILGVSLVLYHVYGAKAGWGWLAQPWVILKLVCVFAMRTHVPRCGGRHLCLWCCWIKPILQPGNGRNGAFTWHFMLFLTLFGVFSVLCRYMSYYEECFGDLMSPFICCGARIEQPGTVHMPFV